MWQKGREGGRDERSIVTCNSACQSFRDRFSLFTVGSGNWTEIVRSVQWVQLPASPAAPFIWSYPPLLFTGWKACICESTLVPFVQVQYFCTMRSKSSDSLLITNCDDKQEESFGKKNMLPELTTIISVALLLTILLWDLHLFHKCSIINFSPTYL